MTPKFKLGRDFCNALTRPQVSSSYVYSFGSCRVDKQTNTQTNSQTNKQTDRRRWKHSTLFATLRRWVMKPDRTPKTSLVWLKIASNSGR